MQAQLADLLRRRSAADAQALAARKAEIAEGLFRQERERAQELQAQARRPRPALLHAARGVPSTVPLGGASAAGPPARKGVRDPNPNPIACRRCAR